MPETMIPNCAITLHFDEATTSFTYNSTHCSSGWQVQPDGSIHPPSKSRVILIDLSGFPRSDVSFAGLQFSLTGEFNSPRWTPVNELEALGITVETPDGYPPTDEITAGPVAIIIDPAAPATQLFYRLAVVVGPNGVLHWDDPKIYDDGTD